VGHALLVPSQAPSDATAASLQNTVFTAVPTGRTLYHRVRKGETLTSIAARYQVSAHDLQTWNSGLGSRVTQGQRLRVISDVAAPSGGSKPAHGKGHNVPQAAVTKKSTRTKPAGRPRSAVTHHP